MPTSSAEAATGDRGARAHGPAWGKIITAVVALLVLAAAWRYTPLSELISAERVANWARTIREMPWAPLLVVLIYTPAAFVMFPRPLLTIITVIAFGPWLGFVYGMIGIMLSALATYYSGWLLPESTVKKLAGEKLTHMRKRLRRHGFVSVFAVRIIPVAPFSIEGIIAGALGVKVWDFTLGTFLGMAPGVLATTVFGMEITNALKEGGSFNWWIVGGVALLFAGLTWGVARWFANQPEDAEE